MTSNKKFEDLWTEVFTAALLFKGEHVPVFGDDVLFHQNGTVLKGKFICRSMMSTDLHGCQAFAGLEVGEEQFLVEAISLVVNDIIILQLDKSYIKKDGHDHLELQVTNETVIWIDLFEAKNDVATEMVQMAVDLAKYHRENNGTDEFYYVSINIRGTNLIACGGVYKTEPFTALRASIEIKEGAD